MKIIYVVRDPRDAAVSFYYHHTAVLKSSPELQPRCPNFFDFMPNATFEDFYNVYWRDPAMAYWGLWEQHVESWLSLRDQHDMLVVRYEALSEAPEREIRRIAGFLGVEVTTEQVAEVARRTTISFMKQDKKCGLAGTKGVDTSVLRKGVVGDWESHFTSPYLRDKAEKLRKMAEQIYTKYNI